MHIKGTYINLNQVLEFTNFETSLLKNDEIRTKKKESNDFLAAVNCLFGF